MNRPTLNDNPEIYTQKLRYYPFKVNLDRCNGSCNTLDAASHKMCVLNKHRQNMICKCKCF